jgi:hypothetical protein
MTKTMECVTAKRESGEDIHKRVLYEYVLLFNDPILTRLTVSNVIP